MVRLANEPIVRQRRSRVRKIVRKESDESVGFAVSQCSWPVSPKVGVLGSGTHGPGPSPGLTRWNFFLMTFELLEWWLGCSEDRYQDRI